MPPDRDHLRRELNGGPPPGWWSKCLNSSTASCSWYLFSRVSVSSWPQRRRSRPGLSSQLARRSRQNCPVPVVRAEASFVDALGYRLRLRQLERMLESDPELRRVFAQAAWPEQPCRTPRPAWWCIAFLCLAVLTLVLTTSPPRNPPPSQSCTKTTPASPGTTRSASGDVLLHCTGGAE